MRSRKGRRRYVSPLRSRAACNVRESCGSQNFVAKYADHPLREIRKLVDVVMISLNDEFDALYSVSGCPSIAPEYLLRALLLQAFYSIRSERHLVEQLDYNLLFRALLQRVGMDRGDPDVAVPSRRQAGWSPSCSVMSAAASASALEPIPKARSTMRASPRMSCVRLKMAACPLRSARITSNPMMVA